MNRRFGLAALAALLLTSTDTAVGQEQVGGADDFFGPSLLENGSTFEPIPEPGDSEVLVEGIAAQGGSSVVLVSEVRRFSAPIEARMHKAGAPKSEIHQMRAIALERLIEERLIDNVVRRLQLNATDTEVNEAVAAKARENGLTVEQLRQSIAGHGLTFEEYRTQIKNLIERQRVLGSIVRSRVRVEDEEIEAFYNQQYANQRDAGSEIHLRHLLIGVSTEKLRDQRTACRIATDIREEIVAGKVSFTEAARLHSDTNAERGGDLGWVHVEELAGWMAPALEGLQPGGVSEIVAMPFGCNLLMLVDRREFQPVSFERARGAIEKSIFNQKVELEYEAWIDKLRGQVYIERKGTYAEASRLRDRTSRE